MIDQLTELQSLIIEAVVARLPSEAAIGDKVAQARLHQMGIVEKEIETLMDELEKMHESARQTLRVCLSDDAPSLQRILRKVAHEKRLKLKVTSVVDRATAYAGKLLDPQNIARIVGAVGGGL